jgi:hypothetical protein
LKLAGLKFKHSLPSNSEVKNEWNLTSAPPVAFMAWTGNISLFTFFRPSKLKGLRGRKIYNFRGLKKRFSLPLLRADVSPFTRGEIKVS